MIFYKQKKLGFCSGVERAIEKATEATGEVYCLGQLVHNKIVTDGLEKQGIKTANNISEIPDGATVIVRAHGVSPDVFEKLKAKNLNIIDATCPYVKIIQQRAKKFFELGYQIVLIGDKKHPEIEGINGWCNNSAIICDGKEKISISGHEKVLIMFQTTFDCEKYEESIENLQLEGVKTLEIFNTICYTTIDRQNYAHFVSRNSDLVVIVGDKNSSNTAKLFEIANRYNKEVLWLTDNNVPLIDLSKYNKIGFIAGASTPKELIEGVFTRMSINAKDAVEQVEVSTAETTNVQSSMLEEAVTKLDKVNYRPGSRVEATMSASNDDGVYVRIPNWKHDAFIANEELAVENWEAYKASLKEGDTLVCSVVSTTNGITLSKKAIEEREKDDALVEGIVNGEQFEIVMEREGKDCLVGKFGSYTVIVHASQVKLGFEKNLKKYIGKPLTLVAREKDVDHKKRTIRASHKEILLQERQVKEDAFWNSIEVNEIVEGKVMRFASFGAFVNVRDFDCLAHTSDISWERISGPEEVLEVGKTYEFVVLALDREKNRVSLGYKQLQPRPWELAAEKFPVGAVVKGKVARIMPFGAFVELDKHIDGLLHISNISWDWLENIEGAVKIGEEIEVQVMEFNSDERRITLSRKALLEKPAEVEENNDSELVMSTEE